MAYKEQFDFNVEGFDNIWQALGATTAQAELKDDDIESVGFLGAVYNTNPTLEIRFKDKKVARKFTAAYLGIDSPNDPEVSEYLESWK